MKSIGKILKSARQKKNFTTIDVYKFIKIHPKYIKAMEADDYSIFKGKVHSKGFLKIYIKFLELDENEILALWRRDYELTIEDDTVGKLPTYRPLEPEKFAITPKLLIVVGISILLFGFFLYLFIQYRQYTDAPTLDLFYPEDNVVVQADVLDISGKVELDSEVFVNNQKIISNPDGSFILSLKLREGINTISIKAVNKLNKETEKIRTIIYRPEEMENVVPSSNTLTDGTGERGITTDETSSEIENSIESKDEFVPGME